MFTAAGACGAWFIVSAVPRVTVLLNCRQFPQVWCIPGGILGTLRGGLRIADANLLREFGGGVSGASESVFAWAVFFAAVVLRILAAAGAGGGGC